MTALSEERGEELKSPFVFFFSVKFSKLCYDGRKRNYKNIFDCIKAQWMQVSEDTKSSYKTSLSDEHSYDVCLKDEQQCEAIFLRFKERLRECHENNECKKCNKSFKDITQHLTRSHVESIFDTQICNACRKSFNGPEDLHKHVIQAHIGKKSSTKSKVNRCKECLIDFQTIAKFKYHRLKIHGKWQGQLECETCHKSYGTVTNLRKHVKIAHSKDNHSSLKSCQYCGYKTYDSYHLKVHLRTHTGDKPFTCNKCTYGFLKKSDLAKHLNTCRGIIHRCNKCQQIFHFRKRFDEHLSWSKECGAIREKVGDEVPDKAPMVRLNTETSFIIGVNCDELEDDQVFIKKKKRAKCGLCDGCERLDSCGKCNPCMKKTKRAQCDKRKCTNLVTQYEVKRGQEESASRVFGPLKTEPKEYSPDFDDSVLFDIDCSESTAENLMLLTEAVEVLAEEDELASK